MASWADGDRWLRIGSILTLSSGSIVQDRQKMPEDPREAAPASNPITDDHLRALGKLTINFGNLEFFVAACLWSLLEMDTLVTAQTVTAELDFRRRLDLLVALARQKLDGDATLEDILELAADARAAEESRNRIVHAHWWVSQDGSTFSRVKYTAKGKKGFQVQQENISPEDLSRVVTQVRDALVGAHTVLVQLLQRFPIRDGQFSVSPASPS